VYFSGWRAEQLGQTEAWKVKIGQTHVSARTIRVLLAFSMVNFVFPS
jgi:hypothetical protein